MKFSTSFIHPSDWFFPESRRYRLEVPALENSVLKIKDFTKAVCRAAGYLPADSNIILLVLEKIVVNIIHDVYQEQPNGKIWLEMSIGMMGLRIRVMDQGKAFDLTGMKNSDPNHYVEIGEKMGLGLWSIPKMTARVCYQSYADHNEWILYYRPSEKISGDGAKKGLAGSSFKFIFASFVFFSFLIFLVYVLSCLVVVPALEVNDSFADRIIEGSKTSLCRGILLVYGMGLTGFCLIFYKLNPFRGVWDQKHSEADLREYSEQLFQDQGEYERLVGAISEMEEKLRESENKIADQDKNQFEMRVIENARQEEIRAFENNKREESQALKNAKNELVNEVEQTKEDIERLSEIKNDLNQQLQDARKEIVVYENEEVDKQKQVKLTQQIQYALFPEELPRVEGFQIGVSYRAAKEARGNYYDFIWVDPVTLGISIGDVCVNGDSSLTVMTAIRAAMRLAALENKSPSNVVLKVHQQVNADIGIGLFANIFYLILDSQNRSVSFAGVGPKSIILYRKSTDEVYFLKSKGFSLGMGLLDNRVFSKSSTLQRLDFQKEDLLIICSDGVTRALNPAKEYFTENRLIKVIRDNAHLAAEELVRKLKANIFDFTAGVEQNDDMTIVAIKENFQSDDVIYKFRKNLLNLVEKDNLSIGEACRKMRVPIQTYYYYKKIYDKKGQGGLKPTFSKKNLLIKELSIAQKSAVISVVKSNPELGPGQIVTYLKKNFKPSLQLDVKAVSQFLYWKGLDESKARKTFATNEIDTV